MRIEPKKILCAIDFSDFTKITLSYGIALAKEFGSQLNLCHIVSNPMTQFTYSQSYIDFEKIQTYEEEQIISAQTRLEELIKDYDIPYDIIVKSGHVADDIGRIALENNIDMVIAATHGRSGIKRFLIGSVTDRLMKTLHCPLLVLHSRKSHFVSQVDHHIHLKKILVGCDFSNDSELAFKYGLSLAQDFQAELHLAHVLKSPEPIHTGTVDAMMYQTGDHISWNLSNYHEKIESPITDEQAQRSKFLSHLERKLLDMIPEECRNWCTPIVVLLEGEPYQELIKYSEHKNVDLIVLGIRGHSLLERFLIGSTTDRVIRRATSSVLAVRQMNE